MRNWPLCGGRPKGRNMGPVRPEGKVGRKAAERRLLPGPFSGILAGLREVAISLCGTCVNSPVSAAPA